MTTHFVAMSGISLLFAMISIVSGAALAVIVFRNSRRANSNSGMVSFNRHLDALSDDSRAHLRQQLIDAQQRQRRK
ncbi:MAG: hypothetical protein ABI570_04160 [Ilumatobacteraceae bacterium]